MDKAEKEKSISKFNWEYFKKCQSDLYFEAKEELTLDEIEGLEKWEMFESALENGEQMINLDTSDISYLKENLSLRGIFVNSGVIKISGDEFLERLNTLERIFLQEQNSIIRRIEEKKLFSVELTKQFIEEQKNGLIDSVNLEFSFTGFYHYPFFEGDFSVFSVNHCSDIISMRLFEWLLIYEKELFEQKIIECGEEKCNQLTAGKSIMLFEKSGYLKLLKENGMTKEKIIIMLSDMLGFNNRTIDGNINGLNPKSRDANKYPSHKNEEIFRRYQ